MGETWWAHPARVTASALNWKALLSPSDQGPFRCQKIHCKPDTAQPLVHEKREFCGGNAGHCARATPGAGWGGKPGLFKSNVKGTLIEVGKAEGQGLELRTSGGFQEEAAFSHACRCPPEHLQALPEAALGCNG